MLPTIITFAFLSGACCAEEGSGLPQQGEWCDEGLESYGCGPWLTADLSKYIIERLEQPVPNMLDGSGGPRHSVLPEALAGLAWMFGSERSRFHGDPRLARFVMLYRTKLDTVQVIPATLGVPEDAEIIAGETSKAHWLDRRHPSRDPEDPSQFYYRLPQNGLILATWQVEE